MDAYGSISDIKAAVERIDERTTIILTNQEKIEDRVRDDFKDVHGRVSRVERKQNWMLGVGSAVVFVITTVAGVIMSPFTGV